jgi:hypothetical protein
MGQAQPGPPLAAAPGAGGMGAGVWEPPHESSCGEFLLDVDPIP